MYARRKAAFATAILLVTMLVPLGRTAEASSSWEAGNNACPNSIDNGTYTFASDACLLQIDVRLTSGIGYPIPLTREVPSGHAGAYVKRKLTLYTGSPCSRYIEIGNIESSGDAAGYPGSLYIEYNSPTSGFHRVIIRQEPLAPNSDFYYLNWSGGDGFTAQESDWNYTSPVIHLGASQLCIGEAGSFIATAPGLSLASYNVPTASFSPLGWNGFNQSSVFNTLVINWACNLRGVPCLNGVFYGGNTTWQENVVP